MRIFRNAAVYFGANVLNAAVPFVLLPFLTRALTPADYGTVGMFTVTLAVLGAFAGLSVHGSIGVRYFQIEREALAEYVACCLAIVAVSGAAVLVAVGVLRFSLEDSTGVPAAWLLVAVGVACLQTLGQMRLSLWQAAGEAYSFALFQVAQGGLNVGLSLLLVLGAGWAWQGRVAGQSVAIAAFGVLAVLLLARGGLLKRPTSWRAPSMDALKFGLPLIPHVLGGLAISSGGHFLVTSMFGVAQTGLYVVSVQLGAAMGLVSDAFVKSYAPWLYRRLAEKSPSGRHFVVGVTYCLILAFLAVSALMSAVIFWVFPLVVGEEFRSGRSLTAFFVFANGFMGMYYAVAGFFFFSSKTHVVSIVTVASGLLSILLMWVLGERLGIKGVASGVLLAHAAMFLLAWLLSNRVCPLPWFEIGPAFAALRTERAANA